MTLGKYIFCCIFCWNVCSLWIHWPYLAIVRLECAKGTHLLVNVVKVKLGEEIAPQAINYQFDWNGALTEALTWKLFVNLHIYWNQLGLSIKLLVYCLVNGGLEWTNERVERERESFCHMSLYVFSKSGSSSQSICKLKSLAHWAGYVYSVCKIKTFYISQNHDKVKFWP